jgi:hypothetical protein
MITLGIMGVVFLFLFFSRNWWADKIGNIVRARREKKKLGQMTEVLKNTSALFSPQGTKRTFLIALDIEELGNGEVNISLAKIKQPEV